MEISSEVAAQYLPKEVVRKIQSTEVNQREIKTSRKTFEQKQYRHNRMKHDLKYGGIDYSKHMHF